jgi:hypothetical protein
MCTHLSFSNSPRIRCFEDFVTRGRYQALKPRFGHTQFRRQASISRTSLRTKTGEAARGIASMYNQAERNIDGAATHARARVRCWWWAICSRIGNLPPNPKKREPLDCSAEEICPIRGCDSPSPSRCITVRMIAVAVPRQSPSDCEDHSSTHIAKKYSHKDRGEEWNAFAQKHEPQDG